MKLIPISVIKVAFNLTDNEPLTEQHLAICEEWASGKGEDYMKVSAYDSRLFEYLGLYDKLEKMKETIWNQLQ